MRIEPFNFDNLRDFSGAEAEAVASRKALEEQAALAAEIEAAEPPPPPPPTYSEEELQQAQQASRDRGFEEGIKAGREQVEGEETERSKSIEQLMHVAVRECAVVKANYQHHYEQQCGIISDFVRVTAEKIAGDLLRAVPHEAIEEVIMGAFPLLIAQPKLTFFVQKEMVDPVHKRILPHLKSRGMEADIDVLADPTMQPSDIRIEWKQGHVQRDTAEIMTQVHALLEHVDFGLGLKELSEDEVDAKVGDVKPLELNPEDAAQDEEIAAEADDVEAPVEEPAAEEAPAEEAAPEDDDTHEVDMGVVTHVATDESEDGIEVMHASEGETYLSIGELDDMVDAPNKQATEAEIVDEDADEEASDDDESTPTEE